MRTWNVVVADTVKNRLALFICLIFQFALVACSERGQGMENQNANPVTITALVWAPDWPQEMNHIADEFMRKNPSIKVDIQFMIGNSVEENIKPKVASRSLPDIISINPNAYAAELAVQGVLADLGKSRAWNNMLDSLKPDWTAPGKRHFGISGGVASTLIYYNKTMFREAGITTLPTNFDEFLALCMALKKAGFVPIVWSGGFPNMIGNGPFSYGFANAVVAGQPDWKAGIANGTLDLDTAATAEIFSKIRLLPDKGFVQKDYLQTTYDEGIRLYTEGKAAMTFQGTWAAGRLMHADGFKTGLMTPPWNHSGKALIPVIGSETGFAVCETGNREAALKFLEFIYGDGFSIQQNKRQNIIPLKKVSGPVISDPDMVAYVNRIGASAVTGSLYYAFLPAGTISMLHPLLTEVMAGGVSPRAAARALDQSIKTEARYRNK